MKALKEFYYPAIKKWFQKGDDVDLPPDQTDALLGARLISEEEVEEPKPKKPKTKAK